MSLMPPPLQWHVSVADGCTGENSHATVHIDLETTITPLRTISSNPGRIVVPTVPIVLDTVTGTGGRHTFLGTTTLDVI